MHIVIFFFSLTIFLFNLIFFFLHLLHAARQAPLCYISGFCARACVPLLFIRLSLLLAVTVGRPAGWWALWLVGLLAASSQRLWRFWKPASVSNRLSENLPRCGFLSLVYLFLLHPRGRKKKERENEKKGTSSSRISINFTASARLNALPLNEPYEFPRVPLFILLMYSWAF